MKKCLFALFTESLTRINANKRSLKNEPKIMTFTKTIERLKLLHELISEEKTNTPEMFARKLCMSRASLYLLINDLKKKKLPISYSRKKKSFVYTKNINLKIDFALEIFDDKHELTKIYGGFAQLYLPSKYLNGRNFIFASYLQI